MGKYSSNDIAQATEKVYKDFLDHKLLEKKY